MMRALARVARIRRNDDGSMAIETAFVAPILLVLALGGFEVSSMVARQTELQSAAAEAAAVVRATIPDTEEKRTTVRNILVTSTGLTNEQVTVTQIYRCGTADDYVTTADSCGSQPEYKFIRVDISDTYTPVWTKFGVNSGFDFNVSRTVQIG
ncbi:TadE/TadG family type IV pilus assembly protein [Aurantiacibacter sp. MUD61]|uniref:TadE/TadG family type IV pilus assembly protein n=1 Tax=Aurantiacibacter sp. MUD61 TaxID=3009083 RepID=UPI0022F06136|nr:TadE/TadG family type IV pilus assembly protein [Aurantiacibacter sp. MUD61]